MIKIYFASPLFNEMEQSFNKKVVGELREKFANEGRDDVTIYLPQEADINDKSKSSDSFSIYEADVNQLEKSDILIANLDGQTVDNGVATEVGYFARMVEEGSQVKRIVGLYTDVRQGDITKEKIDGLEQVGESQFSYVNLFTVGAVKKHGEIAQSTEELVEATQRAVDFFRN